MSERGFIDGEYQDGEVRGLIFLVGMRNHGKTTEMVRLLSLCTGGWVFFDTVSKHAHLFPDAHIFSDPAPLLEYLRVNRGRRFHVLYQPRGGNLDSHFKAVCKMVYTLGWLIFAVDEIDKLCGARHGSSWMPSELYDIVNYGRHSPLSMMATARRPQGVAAGFKAEAQLRLFRLKPGASSDVFADEIGKENLSKVRNLEKYYYLHCVEDEEPELRGGPR